MRRQAARLTGVRLAALRTLGGTQLRNALAEPASAIALLTDDLQLLWDHHRSGDPADRVVGVLELDSGAYLQWIGYSDHLVVECSSNTYLPPAARLTASEEAVVVRAGFQPPDDEEPNFWLVVADRSSCASAAFSVVAVLTAVFGVYAG